MRCSLLTLVCGFTLLATTGESAGMEVSDAWTRALPPVSANGAAYLILHNTGETTDRMLDASSPLASHVHLHETRIENGVAKMGMVEQLSVSPGGQVQLTPGGLHLMLMGLSEPLVEGATLLLRLRFEHAGEVEVELPVLAPDATGAP